MSRRYVTVPAALNNPIKPPRTNSKPLPLDPIQQAKRRTAQAERFQRLASRLIAVWSDIKAWAAALATEFGFSEHHAMNLIFTEGTRMQHARETTNSYNAFLSLKSDELQSSEFSLSLSLSFSLTPFDFHSSRQQ
jgi:hypothetical protein